MVRSCSLHRELTPDPNNALFVTIAGIIIDSQFGDLIDPTVRSNLRKAMYMATVGDGYRVGGVNDDNLRPCYTNPWVMRLAASAYVGHISNDANMTYWAEVSSFIAPAEEADRDRNGLRSLWTSLTSTTPSANTTAAPMLVSRSLHCRSRSMSLPTRLSSRRLRVSSSLSGTRQVKLIPYRCS